MIDPRHSTQGLSVPGRWQGLRSRWCAWGWAESQASRCRGGDEDAGRSLLPSLGLEPLPRAPPWTGVWGKRPTLGLARTAAPQNPPAPGLFPAVALPERARESTQSLPYVLPSRTPRVQSKYSPSSRGAGDWERKTTHSGHLQETCSRPWRAPHPLCCPRGPWLKVRPPQPQSEAPELWLADLRSPPFLTGQPLLPLC